MRERQPVHHAAEVEQAIAAGQAAKSAVVASWHRSARLHRLDPAWTRPPLRLTDAELDRTRQMAEPLLCAAQPVMDRLHQAVGAAGCCVLLADRDGVPIERRGSTADDATFRSWGLWTGAVWSEAREGTNGIGTCLVEQRALTIDRDQHFFTRNTSLSCTAAPVYDQNARLAGVLDVSSCRADRTNGFGNLIALAVVEAARRIEAEIFRAAFAEARIVLTGASDGQAGGLLAVNADDLVIGATKSARLLLGIAPDRLLRPIPATDLLSGLGAEGDQLDGVERGVLQRALLRANGNVTAAAKSLGVSRATLHRKLRRLDLKPH
jgi:transcriptional regulator of acetoin/glycerol metabolism